MLDAVRIAIDARAAAEVPAGRGRYVRELLRGLAALDADHEYRLWARVPWLGATFDSRFAWRALGAPGLSWPLVAGHEMSRWAEAALASTSYAMTAPWRLPGAAIVWDFAAFDRRWRTPRGSLLERVTLPIAVRRCGALIAISETTRGELGRRFPSALARATVARPAADPRFSPQSQSGDTAVLERHRVRPPYVLVTGTVEPRKNLPRVIEAFAGLQPERRRGWTLVLAGAPGWQTEAAFAAVAAHRELVRTLGFVPDDDLACLYRHADVFCYLSLYEGFGIPVLEAMQSGTAVLTSSVSSMPEVGGDAAAYADPRDVRDIQRVLGELLADPGLRARRAAAGRERAAAFSWSDTAARVLATLEGLSGRRR
jgi:glycosyltransferase involved in cell wall biosynthesis